MAPILTAEDVVRRIATMSTTAAGSAFGWSPPPRSRGNTESNFAGHRGAGNRDAPRNSRRCSEDKDDAVKARRSSVCAQG
jgi:hypothetical protein